MTMKSRDVGYYLLQRIINQAILEVTYQDQMIRSYYIGETPREIQLRQY